MPNTILRDGSTPQCTNYEAKHCKESPAVYVLCQRQDRGRQRPQQRHSEDYANSTATVRHSERPIADHTATVVPLTCPPTITTHPDHQFPPAGYCPARRRATAGGWTWTRTSQLPRRRPRTSTPPTFRVVRTASAPRTKCSQLKVQTSSYTQCPRQAAGHAPRRSVTSTQRHKKARCTQRPPMHVHASHHRPRACQCMSPRAVRLAHTINVHVKRTNTPVPSRS